MAGNLPVPLGLETKIVWTFGGVQHALNVLHWRNTQSAAITQAVANAIDSQAKTAFTTSNLSGLLHTTFALQAVHTRSMISNSDPWFIGTAAPVPGSGVGKPLPAAVSYCVTTGTGQRGRSFNGRTYFTGFVEAANDTAGGATEAVRTATVAFINLWFGSMNGATPSFTLCVLSRYTTPPGTTATVERPTPILTSVASVRGSDLRWDTQRRRAIPGI